MNSTTNDRLDVMTIRCYTLTAQALHWIVAGLMFTVLPLAWVMVNMPHTAPDREWIYTLHKSVGLTILALVAVRLGWRALHPAPPLPGRMARWEKALAFASHWLLYLILVGMPVSGYLLSATGGKSVPYFGLITLPSLPNNPAVSDAARWVHVAIGQWLVYVLILLHVGATAWHVAVRRDGVLDRMLPEQKA
ncbi:cytochrome b [Rhodopila sp.]|uniref:cytochrome b n=1 Tax=Rhodopila sp. TaxID=2480087 RepID=UPI003D102D19